MLKLKKSDVQVFDVPSLQKEGKSWSANHRRVFIPFTAAELAKAKNGKKGHIQIVKQENLVSA